jgi:DNA-binding NtrC family response regulator
MLAPMDDRTVTWQPLQPGRSSTASRPALVLVACLAAPERIGEVAWLPESGERVLGRQGTLTWIRQRPGQARATGPLDDLQLSRRQVRIGAEGGGWSVQNVGRLPLRLNGRPAAEGPLRSGDLLEVGDRMLVWVTERPESLPGSVEDRHPFGEVDAIGVVGESPAAWELRERVRFVARRDTHVLVTGESGTGKELVARALHALSRRSRRGFVSRSAATIPESLADAELFGNLAGYPNPGMAARPGLVGEADGGTLFLDEFGELPVELQARLLRVLDSGEYSRLGEARPRRADLRLVAATNRDPASLKHDVAARFPIRVAVPSLADRREDVPLIAVHLLRRIARDDPELARRFFPDGAPASLPRVTTHLVRRLMTHPYTTHVRELESLLWRSITGATGDVLDVPEDDDLAVAAPVAHQIAAGPVDPALIDPATIQEALERHGGRQDAVWRELGLSSRHVLARLIKKYGLTVPCR